MEFHRTNKNQFGLGCLRRPRRTVNAYCNPGHAHKKPIQEFQHFGANVDDTDQGALIHSIALLAISLIIQLIDQLN